MQRPRKLQRTLIKVVPVLVGLFVGVVGLYLLTNTNASVPTASIEAENGVLSNPASETQDSTASGGSAIRFGSDAPAPAAFTHPGVFVSKPQLEAIKAKLAASEQPWASGYGKFYSWTRSSNYTPYPAAPLTLDCDAPGSACKELVEDSIVAYTQALIYYLKGDRTAAQNSAKIMNAWATNLKSSNGNQAKLVLGWSAETMVRAAEIMRYTYTPAQSEVKLNVSGLTTMFTKVYEPALVGTSLAASSSNGNWDLTFINASMNIAIFTDDRPLFTQSVERWRERVKSYIYLKSDGTTPVRPPGGLYNDSTKLRCFWLASNSPTINCSVPSGFAYEDGMVQEICRDISHVASGLSSAVYAAETARIQKVYLYGEEKTRIVKGFEFAAKYYDAFLRTGQWPSAPCGRAPSNGEGGTNAKQSWETAYNAYAVRLNVAMPETLKMINRFRPTGAANQFAWETLTQTKE